MRIDRLFSIVIILLNKDKVTAKELAERFEVSTRTIYRDIDVLSSAGIPIYATQGNRGGISLLDNYTLNKTMISQKDSTELLLALKSLQSTKYPNMDTIIDKLSSLFENINIEDWIEVDFSEWDSNLDTINKFNTIKETILDCQSISILYYNSYGEKTKRVVYPIKLIYKGQSWYLWGFCKLKDDFRLFKLNRIKELNIVGEFFERGKLIKLENYEYKNEYNVSNSETVDLELKFTPKVIYRLYDYFHEKDLIKNDDASYTLKVTYPKGQWIYSFLQSFGDDVEVIHPKFIRNELVDRLERTIRKYKK